MAHRQPNLPKELQTGKQLVKEQRTGRALVPRIQFEQSPSVFAMHYRYELSHGFAHMGGQITGWAWNLIPEGETIGERNGQAIVANRDYVELIAFGYVSKVVDSPRLELLK